MALNYDDLLEDWLQYRPNTNLEFNFLHYENAGELVAGYKYTPLVIRGDDGEWETMPSPAYPPSVNPFSFPPFFDQENTRLVKIIERGTTSSDGQFLNHRTRWIEPFTDGESANYTPAIRVRHLRLEDGTTRIESSNKTELIDKQDIYFGEFFFLSNTYKVIKRTNIKTELLQDNVNHEHFGYLNEDFEYPSDTVLGKYDSFMEWYLGYGPVPEEQRPEFLSIPRITPTPCNLIHTESRRRWNSFRIECLSWIRIYDKSNINEEFKDRKVTPQSMIGQVRCTIDYDKVKEYLDQTFDSLSYPGYPGVDNYVDYDIILYPPSMYMYPADSITEVLEPDVNSLNSFVDRVVFEAPNNFKTDGNFHYKIEFYTFSIKDGPIFITSSYEGSPYYEDEGWYFSKDNQHSWAPVGEELPTFDNKYEVNHGTDGIFTSHIKYVLSKDIFEKVKNNPMIIFKIYQMDGTLVHSNASDFSLAYNINIT